MNSDGEGSGAWPACCNPSSFELRRRCSFSSDGLRRCRSRFKLVLRFSRKLCDMEARVRLRYSGRDVTGDFSCPWLPLIRPLFGGVLAETEESGDDSALAASSGVACDSSACPRYTPPQPDVSKYQKSVSIFNLLIQTRDSSKIYERKRQNRTQLTFVRIRDCVAPVRFAFRERRMLLFAAVFRFIAVESSHVRAENLFGQRGGVGWRVIAAACRGRWHQNLSRATRGIINGGRTLVHVQSSAR